MLLSDPVAPSLEETFEVPMRVRSSSSLHGLSSDRLLPCLSLGVLTRGLSWLPLTGFDFAGLVASGSSKLGAAQSIHSVLSLSHILAFVRCELESPLVPSLSAARLGLWPSGLAIAALPLVSRPWTGLCWSHLMSLSSVSDRSWCYRAGWLAQGCVPLLRPFALLLVL